MATKAPNQKSQSQIPQSKDQPQKSQAQIAQVPPAQQQQQQPPAQNAKQQNKDEQKPQAQQQQQQQQNQPNQQNQQNKSNLNPQPTDGKKNSVASIPQQQQQQNQQIPDQQQSNADLKRASVASTSQVQGINNNAGKNVSQNAMGNFFDAFDVNPEQHAPPVQVEQTNQDSIDLNNQNDDEDDDANLKPIPTDDPKELERRKNQAEMFKKYLDNTGVSMAFQIIYAEILAKKINQDNVFGYTAMRLRQIGNDLAAISSKVKK